MTTATLTLTDFLLARIADDEAAVEGLSSGADPDFFWGPDRIRSECAAKRAVVDLHVDLGRVIEDPRHPESDEGGLRLTHGGECGECHHQAHPCRTLRNLAVLHVDHEDYDASWGHL